ncbi:MAG: hypothetical protein PUC30_06725 [Lachnospiraceae bacterium]|nr:hypothetical protein [Lachnospiraceae bacterium]
MAVEKVVTSDMGYMGDMDYMGDMGYMGGMDGMEGSTAQVSKVDELMSSWVFVGGVTAGVLIVGVLLGILSAKRKIKKGIDLYED